MKQSTYTNSDILNLEKRFRVNLINSLSGFKSANLIGTQNEKGMTNLAIFSSAVHIGSNPALIGLISRPHSVPRGTLENVIINKQYTINHVSEDIIAQAHQTAARYDISEFEATGLTPEYIDGFSAPFVKEATIKIGLTLTNIIDINAVLSLHDIFNINLNNTQLIVGKIEHIILPESIIADDGKINIEAAKTVAVSGLDTYHKTEQLARFSYAKPDKELKRID